MVPSGWLDNLPDRLFHDPDASLCKREHVGAFLCQALL